MQEIIKVCIHDKPYSKKPETVDAARISNEIGASSKVITLERFKDMIARGHTFTMGSYFKENRRVKRNVEGIQVFAVDIDEGNKSLEQLQEDCSKTGLGEPGLIYESFSSKEDYKKWRVVYFSNIIVTDNKLSLSLLRKLSKELGGDRHCVDLARFLYGSADKVRHFSNNTFNPLEVDLKAYESKQTKKTQDSVKKVSKTTYDAPTVELLHKIKRTLVHGTVPRYMAVFNAARRMTGCSRITREDIHIILRKLIDKSDRFKDWDRSDDQITTLIDNSIDWVYDNYD